MTDLTTTDRKQVISSDSLSAELEHLTNLEGIDWTGRLLGKSERISSAVPVIPRKSSSYGNLLIDIRKLEITLKPAKEDEIMTCLARLRLHYAAGYMTAAEFKYLLIDYATDLAAYPKDLIEAACNEYRRNTESQFFPKVGQLIKLINEPWFKRKGKLTRLRKLLEVSNAAWEEEQRKTK